MDQNPVILDISSDEEAALDEPIDDDDVYSWLSRLIPDEVDDSDEVVVVREVKSKSSKPAVNNDDDDDCVVLDSDPDKAVQTVDDQACGGDDLLIVGQKGQIACRDFPHPRHDCAKFHFGSTAHELHCDQCHCYVCDKIAPCAYWGTGVYNNDHCHATDKDAFWRSQRERFKLQKDAPLLVQKVPDTFLSTALPQLNQTPPLDIIRLASNSTTQTQVCKPAVLRPCPSAARFGIPNIISQGRSRQPGLVYNRSGPQQPQLLKVRNNVIRRDRGHNASNIGMFKRAGNSGGALATNQPVYGTPNLQIGSHVMQSTRNPGPQATSNDVIQIGSVPGMNKDSCTYQNTFDTCTSVLASTVPSQPGVYNQPIPDPQAYSQLITQQPIYSQPIPEPPVYSQPIPEPPVYSQPIPEPPVYVQPIPEPQVYVQPIPEPQVYVQPIPEPQRIVKLFLCPRYTPSIFLNQMINKMSVNFAMRGQVPVFFDLDEWVNNISQSNQQVAVENCQLSRTGSTNESLLVKEFNSQSIGSDKFDCNDLEIQNWFPENDSVDMGTEGYIPLNLNARSPEAANFDAGMLLFDFETSWNGLAQV
ncbi:hypothetical protein JRO89_XSUnG0081000 [Xanthoceras sorbifolium]|uniref:Uncharacterized protein n=1 Tax=Xanthoceras sorbifolium TaxID=99658 RepID=A0ABQ8GZK6_9ROSI|nr:hypothetical protein JRO89_XSUnG0081000 [Xanthoceras sorbifolium]